MLAKTELILLNNQLKNVIPFVINYRYGHWLRGKPPGVARTLQQRLAELNQEDTELMKPVNIGFPKLRLSRSKELRERLNHLKEQRKNTDLEKQSRNHTLLINLDDVKAENRRTAGQFQLKMIAQHYGVFNDLFGLAYFVPRIHLDVKFNTAEGAHVVYNGNIIKPGEAEREPEISFDPDTTLLCKPNQNEANLWTIVMTTPDCHLSGENKEYVHWFKANIPGESIKKGETIVSYLKPFPLKGVGYQRYIFILYKQNKKIDFNSFKIENINDLEKRTFSTLDFYRTYQDNITPAGLAFFQSNWDETVTDFFHKILCTKEPNYEYDFPQPYIAKEEWFPLKQPFNLYLDKHRDQKKVHQEYLERKLAKTHPFNGPEPPLRFPNAHPLKGVPSWLKTEIKKNRLRMGRINDV